jgi:diguanylate cyclase (GGDEF)-like protein
MTLARQLETLVAALAVLVFLAGTLIGVASARNALDARLSAQAQVALEVLRPSGLIPADPAALGRLADAVVATGCCDAIRIGVRGGASVERAMPGGAAAVPEWFQTLFPLRPDVARGFVSGPSEAEIEIRPARDSAYDDLWLAAGAAALYSGLAACLLLLAGALGVRALLASLSAVAAFAESLMVGAEPRPVAGARAVDVEHVGRALGVLGRKFEQMLQGAQGLALALREQVATDPLTGLASRRRLVDVLGYRRQDPERGRVGLLLLVQIEGLSALNASLGYAAGDDLLRDVAAALSRLFARDPRNVIAHLAGADFAVLVEDVGDGGAPAVEHAVSLALSDLRPRPNPDWSMGARVGSAALRGQSVSALFGEADRALRAGSPMPDAGGTALPGAVSAASAVGPDELTACVSLVFQPVVAADSRALLHEEAFARVALPGGGDSMPAGEYLATASGPGAAVALDRAVVTAALAALRGRKSGVSVAVNLTPASVADGAAFGGWLADLCREAPEAARRLVLEIPEHCLPAAATGLRAMAGRLGQVGVGLAIDHLGMGIGALDSLRAAPLRYVKIDGSFAANLERDAQSRFFVRAVAQIAHGLDVPVLLEAVETEGVWAMLPDLQIDGGQGYHLGRPA